jgi:hypothetical protein
MGVNKFSQMIAFNGANIKLMMCIAKVVEDTKLSNYT